MLKKKKHSGLDSAQANKSFPNYLSWNEFKPCTFAIQSL